VTGTGRAIRIDPRRLVLALIAVAVLLVLAHVSLLLVAVLTGHDYIFGLVPLFDLDLERNIPSFFGGWLFLLNALLFASSRRRVRPRRPASSGECSRGFSSSWPTTSFSATTSFSTRP